MHIVSILNPTTARKRRSAAASSATIAGLLASLAGAAALAGCATGNVPQSLGGAEPVSASVHYTGSVIGGQQPVAGATIQLMTVGTTGLGSASTNILTSSVTSDANGNFALTGKYSCGSATEVYLLATGGNPGGGTNANIGLAAALGNCATLLANANTTFVTINEVTTVAAAYGLAPFAASGTAIGSTGSLPTGLVNAFGNAFSLSNTTNGSVGGTNLPAGATVPVSEINTLADILASCVNSTGGNTGACGTLFTATSTSDTFSAAIAIAKNPGAAAITGLYSLASSTSPFQPSMSSQPTDFSVAITYSPTTPLATPYAIALDASGNAWITNEAGASVTELSPAGAFTKTLTASGLFGAQGVAVDPSGNVWVANTAGNSVLEFTGGTTAGAPITAGVSAPSALAIDSAGNVFVANFNGNSVAGFSNAGAALSGSPFTGNANIANPSGIAVGPAGNVYVTSGNGYAVKLTNAGAYSATYTDSTLQGPVAVALDPSADLFLTGFTTGTAVAGGVSEFNSTGTSALAAPEAAGISTPAGVAIDGASVWVANSTASGSLAKLTFGAATSASPAGGFGSLSTPVGVAVDGTGSVWTTNSGSNTVSKFVGIAAPVTTPLSANHTFVGP